MIIASSITFIEYSSDKQRLWSDCTYAQADLSLCWSHIPHSWKSHALAHIKLSSKQITKALISLSGWAGWCARNLCPVVAWAVHVRPVSRQRPESLCFKIMWASIRETLTLLLAINKGTDQPAAHLRSLISAFVIGYLKSKVTRSDNS